MAQSNKAVHGEFKSAALLLGIGFLGILNSNTFAANNLQQAPSQPAIIFTDAESAILRADGQTGGAAVVAAGQKLVQPFGICIGKTGEYFVTDTGCMGVLGIDPQTGIQRIVSSGGRLGMPFGIAMEADGMLLVANGEAVLRIDPQSGAQTVLTTAGYLRVPLAVAVGVIGSIFVADALGAIVEVNGRTGEQRFVTAGGYLHRPQGIAARGKDIYVTDVATTDGNFGTGRIVRINAQTGEQTVVSEGENLVGPVGIAIDQKGDLVVGDPYTINMESADLFDGAIIRIDAGTGAQQLIARGKEGFVNPRCVTLVRNAE